MFTMIFTPHQYMYIGVFKRLMPVLIATSLTSELCLSKGMDTFASGNSVKNGFSSLFNRSLLLKEIICDLRAMVILSI